MASLTTLLLPLFTAIALGVAAGAFRVFGQDEARTFSRFVFSVAMPIAVFNFMRKATPPDWSYLGLMCGYLAALFIAVGILFFILRTNLKMSVREAGAVVFASTCGNAVFFGLPIAISVPDWGVPFLMLMICEGIFVFAIGTALITWPENEERPAGLGMAFKSVGDAFIRVAQNPIIIGHVIGTCLSFGQVQLPEGLSRAADFFGGVASPMGLFVLGLYLVLLARDRASVPGKVLAYSLPIKLLFLPALAATLVWSLTKDVTFTAVVTFFAGVPPAVSSMVFAATFKQSEREVAAIVGIGTLIGLVTTTIYLATVAV